MWKTRAEEYARVRDEVVRRMQAARQDVYAANLRAEEAEIQAQCAVKEATARAERAEAALATKDAEAKQMQIERNRALMERDLLLSSTMWRVTWPLRAIAQCLPAWVRPSGASRAGKLSWLAKAFPRIGTNS